VILDRFRLTGKVAAITGAGRGIGAAAAVALAEAGADVVISARTESDLAEVAAKVAATGRTAHPVVADLGIPTVMPVGVGRPENRIHAPNENIRIDDYLNTIRLMCRVWERFGAG